jgi:type IV secretory pathway TrbL component
MFWAVQGMAAELTTGALMLKKIKESGRNISMLVANNNAAFTKKATGRLTFECNQGLSIDSAITKALETGEGQTVWLNAVGKNKEGVEVSNFNFEWSIKLKNQK